MNEEDDQGINEKEIKDSKLIEIDRVLEVSGAICRIIINNTIGTGFFMRLEKSNKSFYCLITCEHVIKEEMIDSKNEIEVYYDNQKSKLKFPLNKDERFIRSYRYINIDATVIEILQKDNVDDKFFLLPNLDYINGYEQFEGQDIYIPQFPGEKNLSFSLGKIKLINIYTNEFTHLASTRPGSSGSPIFLAGSSLVLGIHKKSKIKKEENYGNFLGPVFNSLKNCNILVDNETTKIEFDNIRGYGRIIINKDDGQNYIGEFNKEFKLNGKGVIYSKDRKKIFEGNFVDDVYEGKRPLGSKDNNKFIIEGDFLFTNFKEYGKQKDEKININDYINNAQYMKNKIENEIQRINKSYEKMNKETTKYFKLKHDKLKEEEKEIKDKLDNEVTKIKEKLEEYYSFSASLIRNFEKIKKEMQNLNEDKQNKNINMTKNLTYVSQLNENQKQMKKFSKILMKNLQLYFVDGDIKYEEYYFNGLSFPKDIQISDITFNSCCVSWKIDDELLLNLDERKIKYKIEIRKILTDFKSIYEDTKMKYNINNLEQNTKYEIRLCTIYNGVKSENSDIIKFKTPFDSILLNEINKLDECLSKIYGWTGSNNMELLYRGTRDGMSAHTFHNKCDNKGPTICLFKNEKGYIFGGYTFKNWSSSNNYILDPFSFIFTLTNMYNIPPTKFPNSNISYSIYDNSSYGPTFGGGHDIYIGFNSNSTNFPHSFKDILGKGISIFKGDKDNDNFSLKEIEVFKLIYP